MEIFISMMHFVRPIMENVDEIFQKIQKKKKIVRSWEAKKLNIDDKTVLRGGHLRKTEWKKSSMFGCTWFD